jgi:hypothetical protein
MPNSSERPGITFNSVLDMNILLSLVKYGIKKNQDDIKIETNSILLDQFYINLERLQTIELGLVSKINRINIIDKE